MKPTVMKKICWLIFILGSVKINIAQNVGIGTTTPDVSAQLDITSSNKGLLIPRMTTAQLNAISNPGKGLLVLDTVLNLLMVNNGSASLPSWQTVSGTSGWGLTGNAGINPAVNFIGTTDNQPLRFRVNNINAGMVTQGNTSFGLNAFNISASGQYNTATGRSALQNNTSGNENTAIGDEALLVNSSGINNVAIGSSALRSNTTASNNTATGTNALFYNTGSGNSAYGTSSANFNTTGSNNSSFGFQSLTGNSTGSNNCGFGYSASYFNSTGVNNSSFGYQALYFNSTGGSNAAFGAFSSYNNTASSNSSFGDHASYSNTSGAYNAAIGASAMYSNSTGSGNTALGSISLQTNISGDYNTAVGSGADVLAGNFTNATAVGANSMVGASNSLVLGSVNGVNGATSSVNVGIGTSSPQYTLHVKERFPNSADGIMTEYDNSRKWLTQVDISNNYVFEKWNPGINGFNIMGYVSGSTGQYIQVSDRSLKKNISNLDRFRCLENLMRLNPVHYQLAFEPSGSGYTYGFISQEVEPVFPDIVVNNQGIKMIGYSSFIPILTKAVQEQQQLILELRKEVTELKKMVAPQK